MTWSGWDVGVIVAGIAQITGVAFVARAALQIKNGPVKRVQNRVPPIIDHGKALASAGQDAWQNNREQALLLANDLKNTVQSIHHAVTPPAVTVDAPINYQKIGRAWAGLKTAQQGLGFVRRVARRKAASAAARPAPFAERIGLVPPASKPVGRVLGAAKLLLRVRALLKSTGLV